MLSTREQEIVDGMMLAGAAIDTSNLAIHCTDKTAAEWLYNEVSDMVLQRNLETNGERYPGREYYLELSESASYTLDDEDDFSWNRAAVWELTLQPNGDMYQYIQRWYANNQSYPALPGDFALTPVTAKVLYKTRAHELPGENTPYIEFETRPYPTLNDYLNALNMEYDNLRGLYRLTQEASAILRTHIGVKNPRPNGGE